MDFGPIGPIGPIGRSSVRSEESLTKPIFVGLADCTREVTHGG